MELWFIEKFNSIAFYDRIIVLSLCQSDSQTGTASANALDKKAENLILVDRILQRVLDCLLGGCCYLNVHKILLLKIDTICYLS